MDWAAIENWATHMAAVIASRVVETADWLGSHPAVLVSGVAGLIALAALLLARGACRAARIAADRSDAAAGGTANLEAAVSALRHELTSKHAQSDAALHREQTLAQDALTRLERLEAAVDQLRADVIDQQTAKYRINEAIRQAMER
jgi:hypothetical protein